MNPVDPVTEVSIETVSSGAQTPNSLSAQYRYRIFNCKKTLPMLSAQIKEFEKQLTK